MTGSVKRKRSDDAAESKNLSMRVRSMRVNREDRRTPARDRCGPVEKGEKPQCRHARRPGVGRSIVPTKRANKAGPRCGSGVR